MSDKVGKKVEKSKKSLTGKSKTQARLQVQELKNTKSMKNSAGGKANRVLSFNGCC